MSTYRIDNGQIIRDDGTVVPRDPANADYQDFLRSGTAFGTADSAATAFGTGTGGGARALEDSVAAKSKPPAAPDSVLARAVSVMTAFNASEAALHAELDKLDTLRQQIDAMTAKLRGP